MTAVTITANRIARCLVCGEHFPQLCASRLTCSDACRQKRSRALRVATPPLPDGPFDLIYADPPWQFRILSRGRKIPYAQMDLSAICRLPVSRIAARDSILAIWVNDAGPAETLRVVKAWGFGAPNGGFVWVKVARSTSRPYPGLGRSTRKDTEQVHRSRRQCCVGQASARADHNNHVIPERDGLFDLTHSSGCRRTGDERSAANRKRSVFWVSSPSPQRHPLLEQYACGGAEAAGIKIVALNLRVFGGNGIMAIVDLQMTNWCFCFRRCIWRRRNGRDWIELPCDRGQFRGHRDARRFQKSALAAARKLTKLAEVSAQ